MKRTPTPAANASFAQLTAAQKLVVAEQLYRAAAMLASDGLCVIELPAGVPLLSDVAFADEHSHMVAGIALRDPDGTSIGLLAVALAVVMQRQVNWPPFLGGYAATLGRIAAPVDLVRLGQDIADRHPWRQRCHRPVVGPGWRYLRHQ